MAGGGGGGFIIGGGLEARRLEPRSLSPVRRAAHSLEKDPLGFGLEPLKGFDNHAQSGILRSAGAAPLRILCRSSPVERR
jgi:hypothetical protein